MISPKSYTVRKYPLSLFIKYNYKIPAEVANDAQYQVLQSDTMLLRQIRIVSNNYDDYNPFIVFIDATGAQNKPKVVRHLIEHGAKIGKYHFSFGDRSASMIRQFIFSMVESHIWPEVNKRISMDLDFKDKPTVLSKYYAYRGLVLSSCHCIALREWFPKIIVVPDTFTTIPNQKIKYVRDEEVEFVDQKTGAKRTWKQKAIAKKETDIEINMFDGCGIAHPSLMREVEHRIGTTERINSMVFRMPYFKGVFNEMDYVSFYEERGVTEITDIWGIKHSVTRDAEPMFIACESMYKGYKYFKQDGTVNDWNRYKELALKYDHALGIAKWNYQADKEVLVSLGNYQLIQDLQNVPFDEFKHLADKSVDWYEKIVRGDPIFTYCFLGALSDNTEPLNHYVAAIMRNPEMVHEPSVKDYFHSLLDKYRNGFKCGKLFFNATFKFLLPDQIALMEAIAELPIKGCLKADEFYSFDRRGVILGERALGRNPHICHQEHVKLKGVDNELTQKYCSHLVNCCMINVFSITPQRLSGADYDGDLTLLSNEPIIINTIPDDGYVTIDIEDKVTSLAQVDNLENKLACTLRGLKSMIGEISNMASVYHNRVARTEETKQLYEGYIDLLSVANGKAVDFAKTGVLYPIPRQISKWAKASGMPYFFKYNGPYYARLHNLSKAHSNMNLLCMSLERWERGVRWRKEPAGSFDWHIMYDDAVGYDQAVFDEIEAIFLDLDKYRKIQLEFEKKCHNWQLYKNDLKDKITKEEAKTYETNWQAIYNVYRNKCKLVCPDVRELANILVVLCYEKYPNKFKKFLWHMAGAGVVENIKPVPVQLPVHDPNGEYEYLGQRYSLAEPKIYEARVK